MLALEAAIKGTPDKVPAFINGAGFVQGEYKFPDGSVKSIKDDYFYSMQKGKIQSVTDKDLKEE